MAEEVGKILVDAKRPMKERFRALFTLRNLADSEAAIDWIAKAFNDTSVLLKHECAFCLGQMRNSYALPVLSNTLKNTEENAMVRHEAGEALGAIGDIKSLELLQEYLHDPSVEVAETCELAVDRIKWLHSPEYQLGNRLSENPYLSVDPAPPSEEQGTRQLQSILLDETLPLFKRYRAMFSLRNSGDKDSVLALSEGLKCKSALFRHEIAYVLGQVQSEAGVSALAANLKDDGESAMVRHECAEALGAIATEECMTILRDYAADKERVVQESCEVALDMCDYEQSGTLQYADTLAKTKIN